VHEVFVDAARRPTSTAPPTGVELLSGTHGRAVAVLRRLPRTDHQPLSVEPGMDLPEEQGRALLLSYWSGYTQQELAALTGVAVSVVRARMLAGMTVLTQARQDSTSVAPSARQTG